MSLFPQGDALSGDLTGTPTTNDPTDSKFYYSGAECYNVGGCDQCKEKRLYDNRGDAGPSLRYKAGWPNSNTYVRYQLTKAGCVPPNVRSAPGYNWEPWMQ
jgi:hypothetical protein